jgi:hypothetical protein
MKKWRLYRPTVPGFLAGFLLLTACISNESGLPGIDKQLALEASVNSASCLPWAVTSDEYERKNTGDGDGPFT